VRLRLDPYGPIRVAAIAAIAATVYASPTAAGGVGRSASASAAAAATASNPNLAEPSLYRQISNRMLASGTGRISPWVRASLAFVVSVCLDDVGFSVACRERSLLEAARRLEQIFIDNYTTERATGSLRVWFPSTVESQEQLRFLHEAEDRAIEAATTKLQSGIGNPPPYQQLRAWHDAASMEASSGRNWLHDWLARTHQYQVGPARHQLAHMRQ
jgi:hypothetical protein